MYGLFYVHTVVSVCPDYIGVYTNAALHSFEDNSYFDSWFHG